MTQSRMKSLAAAGIVAVGVCFLTAVYSLGLKDSDAAARDFIGYWAAGQQIVHGADPYDPVAVLRIEKAVGLGDLQIKITPSPPIGLGIVVPLGFFNAKNGLVFWIMAQMICLAASLFGIWILAGRPPTRVHLFGFLFAPAVACIMAGQIGVFCLAGVVGFLLLHATRPFWAGAALLPCCLKPHLFLPVVLCLVLWCFLRRSAWIFAGFAAAMAASYGFVLTFDRNAWAQFAAMMHSNIVGDRFSPTLSAYLRWDVAPSMVWLEYSPTVIACIWAVWFFMKKRANWTWSEQGLVVLLVSVMCAPYAWITDESVLLPAVLGGVYAALSRKRSIIPICACAGIALIELFAELRITSWYYTWTAPAWLAWYIFATRNQTPPPAAVSLPQVR